MYSSFSFEDSLDVVKTTIRLSQAIILGILFLCTYNTLLVFQGFVQEKGLQIEMEENNEGAFEIQLSANPENRGCLEVDLVLTLKIISLSNESLAENYTSLKLGPGSAESFVLMLNVPRSLVDKYRLKESGGYMEVEVGVSLLRGFFKVSNKLKVGGAGEF
jgi:hypothetical protein